MVFLLFFVFAQHGHTLTGAKSPSRPDNGKATAKDKGVRGDAESEGSLSQTSALMHKNMI